MRVLFTLVMFGFFFNITNAQSTEGFENSTFPTSWINNGCFIATVNACSGSRILAFNAAGDNVITPLIVMGGTISFDYRRSSNTTAWSLDVAYSSSSSGPWTPLGTISNATTTCQNISYSIPNNVYVRFNDTRSSGTNDRYIDDVTVQDLSLPVNFINFNIESNKLSFSTSSETNNDYFTIERSGDGRSFDAIGEIKGAGNSSEEKHYEFTDENPLPGINYYRIKQTDFDGQYSYSEIRSVRHTGKGNVAISPRSTDGRLDISTEMESYDVAVYSSAGQEVARFAALSGHQSVSIEALQAGVYFVKVMSGAESETVRVVKY
jgi:hypothetical protein